jgi:hypothetical protein
MLQKAEVYNCSSTRVREVHELAVLAIKSCAWNKTFMLSAVSFRFQKALAVCMAVI